MSRAGVEAVGLSKIAATLAEGADTIGDLTAANLEVAQKIASTSRSSMPRKTGAMAASTRATSTGTEARVTVGVRYARPRLFGAPRAGTRPAPVTPVTVAEQTGVWMPVYLDHAATACATVKGK